MEIEELRKSIKLLIDIEEDTGFLEMIRSILLKKDK